MDLESLADRKWTRKKIHKTILGLLSSYLKEYLIPYDSLKTCFTQCSTQKTIKTFPAITKTFESSLFSYCAEAWGNLIEELRNIDLINAFKSSIFKFIRSIENSVLAVHDSNYEKLLTRLRFSFNHLNGHKSQHNFDSIITFLW